MSNGYNPSYRSGDYKAICDRCGRIRKGSELRGEWDSLFVCFDSCWEPRQPQDFTRTIQGEGRAVYPARPDTANPTFQEDPENWPEE